MSSLQLPTAVFFDLGRTLTFFDATNQRQPFADALDTLQILHERGYRLGLLSNQSASATVDQVYALLAGFGFTKYIERELVTISSEIPGNVGKPNQPIFDLALDKAGHSAASDQSIFVTETLNHIQAARNFGWRAILKRNAGACQPAEGECVTGLSGLLDLLPPLADIAGTNLHLAPPAKMVDGLVAAPIDIQRISAELTFDGATESGTGDATLDFTMGRQAGNPIFDLRQTITAVWLDGMPLSVAEVAHHDFGGGPSADLRVVESVLAAGSAHTLRVTYDLGPPQASTAGSYQPQITWSSGPRLTYNFGFTDLGPGRYLESWIPANLIYDQMDLDLEIRLLNTTIPHTVITNGTVTALGTNHWTISFPAYFTAFSPLLEIRASDTVTNQIDTVTLPVSGKTVTIEAWRLVGSGVDLTTQLNNLKTWLVDNENNAGPYHHGDRFVAFFHVGGMEYDFGTTTSTGALRHETFHSWWGRGLKPASQPDAWWDEAWTKYNDFGAAGSVPFDFSDPPVNLSPRNPWIRVTNTAAYSAGRRFFDGVASLLGVSNLKSFMRDFYVQRKARPATTTELEEFLVCRSGEPRLVDAFHRFVYGLGNPSPVPNLWLRDDPAHTGTEFWGGRFWNSPDLWIRNADDGGLTHQPPEYGQDNWFHARIRNRSTTATARHFLVTFNVKSFAGVQFTYPTDFLPCVAAVAGFELGPGQSTIVKARWPRDLVPPVGTHACWLAAVLTRFDHPISGRHVWEHNNLAQKNLTIVDLSPGSWLVLPFVVANVNSRLKRRFQLELIRPKAVPKLEAALLHRTGAVFEHARRLHDLQSIYDEPADRLECGAGTDDVEMIDANKMFTSDTPGALVAKQFAQAMDIGFQSGQIARVPIVLRRQETALMGLKVHVPRTARKGDVLKMDLVQRDRDGRRVLGGLALEIHVK
jgi:hypothetical protein